MLLWCYIEGVIGVFCRQLNSFLQCFGEVKLLYCSPLLASLPGFSSGTTQSIFQASGTMWMDMDRLRTFVRYIEHWDSVRPNALEEFTHHKPWWCLLGGRRSDTTYYSSLRLIALRVLDKLSLKITSAPLRVSPPFPPDFEYDLTLTRILLILAPMFQHFRRSSYLFFLCSSADRFNLGWNNGDLHAHLLVPLPLLWNNVLFRVFNQPEKPFCYANIRRVERRLIHSMNSCQWDLKSSDLLTETIIGIWTQMK